MGIYISGMKMPTHCMDCQFMVSRDNDDCILQSAESNESFENWEQMKAGCPLIELPPHGRLIDADDTENITVIMNENGSGFNRIVAPTIIPADREEDT